VSFAAIEAAEVNGQAKRRSLIVRDAGQGVVSDDILHEGDDALVGERVPIALGRDGLEERRQVRWLVSGSARINARRDGALVEHLGILPLAVCAMRGRRDGRGDRSRRFCNGMSHMRHADAKGGASGESGKRVMGFMKRFAGFG